MLQTVKLALRITTDAFDSELNRLIAECIEEMTGLGITIETEEDTPTSYQVKGAIVAYCKWQFGENDDAWRGIYDRKLAQLQYMTGYGLNGGA